MSTRGCEFAGKRVLITGGTQGLGLETARRFAEHGAELFLTYRSNHAVAQAAASALTQAGAARVETGAFDLTDPLEIEKLWLRVQEVFPTIDVYIHNAAATAFKPLLKMEAHHIDKTFNVTVKSFVLALSKIERLMPNGGTIVTISGMDTLKAVPYHGLLGAAKAALENLTQHAAHELAPKKIRVNGVNPGFFDTESTRKYLGPAYKQVHQSVAAQSPFHRLPALSEIAEAITFLASSRSSWICGQTLIVDGGADFSVGSMLPRAGA